MISSCAVNNAMDNVSRTSSSEPDSSAHNELVMVVARQPAHVVVMRRLQRILLHTPLGMNETCFGKVREAQRKGYGVESRFGHAASEKGCPNG